MKKIIALLLVLTLALSFGACGNNGAAPEDGGKKVLRVGMECAYAPYNWSQTSDANGAVPIADSAEYAYGYDVMIAKYLADKMGYELEIYKIDWAGLPVAVQSGKIDCVIAGMSVTAERLETVDFTDPYYYATIHAVVKKDSPYASATSLADLAGAKVTSQMGTIWYTICAPQIPDAEVLPAIEEVAAMWVALDSGKCDVIVTDQPAALGACAVYDDFVMLDLSAGDFVVSDEEVNIGVAVQKGNSELLAALNDGLSTLTTDDYTEMMQQAIALSADL